MSVPSRTFQLLPFELFGQPPANTLLFSSRGVSNLHSTELVQMLRKLKATAVGALVPFELLAGLAAEHGLDPSRTLSFLTSDVRALREVNPDVWRWRSVKIFADELLRQPLLLDEISRATGLPAGFCSAAEQLREYDLAVIIQEKYNSGTIDGVYREMSKKERGAISCAHVRDRFLLVDSLWVSGCYVPCHFCHINHLRAKGGDRYGPYACDPLAASDDAVEWEFGMADVPLSMLDRSMILHATRNRIREIAGPRERPWMPSDASRAVEISLDGYAAKLFSYPLWSGCSCLSER